MAESRDISTQESKLAQGVPAQQATGLQSDFLRAYRFYHRFRFLAQLTLRIDSARGLEDIIAMLRAEEEWLVEHDIGFLCLFDASRSHYSMHGISQSAEQCGLQRRQFPGTLGSPGWVAQHREPVIGDFSDGSGYSDAVDGVLVRAGMRSSLTVPLRTGETTMGSFMVCSSRRGAYGEEDVWVAQMLARQVAISLKNAALYEDDRKRIRQIELVNQIAEKLTSTLELDELLSSAAEAIRSNFKYHDVSVFIVDRAAKLATLAGHAGGGETTLPAGYVQEFSDGIIGWVAAHGQRVVVNDIRKDPRYLATFPDTRSEFALPIIIDGKVAGVLNVEDVRTDAFDDMDIVVLETLSDQMSSAIKNARLYDQLRKANTTLTEVDRLKSDFISIVSHDFRAPLASIILAAKGLLRPGGPINEEQLNQHLKIIIDQAAKLSQLAEDTLSVTKLEAGQLTYYFQDLKTESLITEAAAMVNFSRRHSLQVHVDKAAHYVFGDESKLRQVLQNLISNAVKYSPDGGKITVGASPEGDGKVRISVTDEGVGIPLDRMDRLFQKFSRIDTDLTREIKGSGLGLWICRELVKAHGGEISAECLPGGGSRFSFTLPGDAPTQS